MRGVGGVAAAVLAVALGGHIGSAAAGDDAPATPHFLLFTGADLWRNGGFAHAGMMWAVNGLDSSGPVLKLAVGGGLYRYHSGALGGIEITGYKTDAVALAGWRLRHGELFVTALAGLDWQRHKLLPDDPTAGLRGSYTGLRAAVDVWHRPTTDMMLAAAFSATTIGPSYSGRLAVGWRLFESFYVGPEVAGFTANGNYRQYRAGIHVTGLKLTRFSRTYLEWLNFDWSAGFGLARDSDHRQSAYIRLGLSMRR